MQSFLLGWEWKLNSAYAEINISFHTYLREPPQSTVVRMGTIPHKVKGIERVSFKLKEKDKVSTVNLHNVLYVSNNLISISISDKASLHATMGNGFKVFDRS